MPALAKVISIGSLVFLVAIAVAVLLAALVRPQAPTRSATAGCKVKAHHLRQRDLVMSWQGPIAAPMAAQISEAFEARKAGATRVVLHPRFRRRLGGRRRARHRRAAPHQADPPAHDGRRPRAEVRLDVRVHLRPGARARRRAHERVAVPRGLAPGPQHQADHDAQSAALGALDRQVLSSPPASPRPGSPT